MDKNKRKNRKPGIGNWKYIIALLALINLILLFGLDYQIPGLSRIVNRTQTPAVTEELYPSDAAVTESNTQSGGAVSIAFDTDPLVYDGTGTLDLSTGVTVTDESGNEMDPASLFADISAGDTKTSKVIKYRYSDEAGNTGREQRGLTLSGSYSGPSISFGETMPAFTDESMADARKALVDAGALNTNDGYGNDANEYVTVSAAPSATAGSLDLTLTLTNLFGDTTSAKTTVAAQLTAPHLALVKDSEILSKGDTFDATKYIAYAIDTNGTDLSGSVTTEGTVTTTSAGTYTVTYHLQNAQGENAEDRTLNVTVTE